jgi:hypothetical protein
MKNKIIRSVSLGESAWDSFCFCVRRACVDTASTGYFSVLGLDFGVSLISPATSPRIFDPDVFDGTIFTAMSNSQYTMISAGAAFV